MFKVRRSAALLAGVIFTAGMASGVTAIVRADTPVPATPAAPTPSAPPAAPTPPPRPMHHGGTVIAVDATAGTITIKGHKGVESTFTTTADTKITAHGTKGSKLSDIQVGWHASISSSDGTTALAIKAGPIAPKPADTPAPPAPAPAPATPPK